ncbi:phage tail protein [uncultured Massilia sp.]|uniref:phage tail protein n=1 Tax=uncultured Massilia sp. TaxID=169973 RepID=UPI0025CFBC89|nr:tail fiber protein [uncultured Massilia sp.]
MIRPERLSRPAACCALALAALFPAAAQACSSDPYLGDVCMVALRFCPPNYMPADGRLLPVAQYRPLFARIGFNFGGDGSTQFALPDLRGRAVIGQGQGGGLQNVAIGQQLGQQALTLDPGQLPIPAHTHDATFVASTGPGDITLPAVAGNLAVELAVPVGGTADNADASPASDTVYLAGMSLTGATLTGPYTTVAPPTPAPSTLQAQLTASGSAPRTAATVATGIATGGTVAVAASDGKAPSAPVRTQTPSLGVTTCIAVTDAGFPTYPD